jgi:hypothetical protein
MPRKLSASELTERINLIQSLFDKGYTKKEILSTFKNIKNFWFQYTVYNIHHHCNICKTTNNLKNGNKGVCDICVGCFNLYNLDKRKFKGKYNNKSKEERLQEKNKKDIIKEENKCCKYCGTKNDLLTYKRYNKIIKRNLCKQCGYILYSDNAKKIWNNYSEQDTILLQEKKVKKWKETFNTFTEEEKKNKWNGESAKEYFKNETEEQKSIRLYNQKQAELIKTKQQKEQKSIKISETWSKKSREEINERSEKIFKTKINNGTFNNFQVFGYDKNAQELFWYLHDNIVNIETIKYATINTRDINNPQNNEYKIRVKDISDTNSFRNLDFYLKLQNGYEINIEYDVKYHKKRVKEDLQREQEILNKKPNILIFRVDDSYFIENKLLVKDELLNIINNISTNNIVIQNKNYYPLHIVYK